MVHTETLEFTENIFTRCIKRYIAKLVCWNFSNHLLRNSFNVTGTMLIGWQIIDSTLTISLQEVHISMVLLTASRDENTNWPTAFTLTPSLSHQFLDYSFISFDNNKLSVSRRSIRSLRKTLSTWIDIMGGIVENKILEIDFSETYLFTYLSALLSYFNEIYKR